MQQEMQKETEFSLSEIFSALLAKWKKEREGSTMPISF